MSIPQCWMAAVCAAVMSVLPAQGKGEEAPPTTRRAAVPGGLVVGIVDLGKAFDLYPRTIKERDRLQKLADGARGRIDKIRQRIQELRATIDVLGEGSYERDGKQLELELAMKEHQGVAALLNDQVQLEQMRMRLSIYEDLDAAVARLAKDRGVHLVLRREEAETAPPAEGDKDSPKMVQNRLIAYDQRHVWFAAEELDLTADLIKLLQVWPLDAAKDAPAAAPAPAADKGADGGGG